MYGIHQYTFLKYHLFKIKLIERMVELFRKNEILNVKWKKKKNESIKYLGGVQYPRRFELKLLIFWMRKKYIRVFEINWLERSSLKKSIKGLYIYIL